ncbi:hypothetical protein OH76DRAFT_1410819, partial [Lentinus brumalis]
MPHAAPPSRTRSRPPLPPDLLPMHQHTYHAHLCPPRRHRGPDGSTPLRRCRVSWRTAFLNLFTTPTTILFRAHRVGGRQNASWVARRTQRPTRRTTAKLTMTESTPVRTG